MSMHTHVAARYMQVCTGLSSCVADTTKVRDKAWSGLHLEVAVQRNTVGRKLISHDAAMTQLCLCSDWCLLNVTALQAGTLILCAETLVCSHCQILYPGLLLNNRGSCHNQASETFLLFSSC